MPETVVLGDRQVHLYWETIHATPQDDDLRATLNDDELSRVDRLQSPEKRALRVVQLARRRRILSRYLQVAPRDVIIDYDPNGRPLIPDGLYISCSYSQHAYLLAISRFPGIGVDVENMHDYREMGDVTRHLSKHDMDTLSSLSPRDVTMASIRMWTRKEAFAKGIGTGLFHEPRDMVVPSSPDAVRWEGRPLVGADLWHLRDLEDLEEDFVREYVATVAYAIPASLESVTISTPPLP